LNSLLVLLGIESWKPIASTLLLSPVPMLVLVLLGARLIARWRGLGWTLVLAAVALLWFGACTGTASLLTDYALRPPPPLSAAQIEALRATAGPHAVIVVLGGGMRRDAPEYGGTPDLAPLTLQRLRYGIWLSRQTGIPLAFSGGIGWGVEDPVSTEAHLAEGIAAREYGRPLAWSEDRSRDTHENAGRSVALAKTKGVQRVVLVTHSWHMPRALRNFKAAAAGTVRIDAAPMGVEAKDPHAQPTRWIPSGRGALEVYYRVHEYIGLLAGA
jgi:uncharacterized SAM-binding protein YcdF (DUF218 family)